MCSCSCTVLMHPGLLSFHSVIKLEFYTGNRAISEIQPLSNHSVAFRRVIIDRPYVTVWLVCDLSFVKQWWQCVAVECSGMWLVSEGALPSGQPAISHWPEHLYRCSAVSVLMKHCHAHLSLIFLLWHFFFPSSPLPPFVPESGGCSALLSIMKMHINDISRYLKQTVNTFYNRHSVYIIAHAI